ncbi:hypothetical protein NL108_007701 [Boleophthalmus pectinirostris]|nr:hypothetical protein NL108_007701 [Boleophthalmus pectinirostris]
MTAHTEELFSTQNEHVLEQIRLLQHALAETKQKLDDVREKTTKTSEDILECTKETKWRADLLMGNEKVIDVLRELGELLEKERSLKEQLDGQSEEDRRLWEELQDRNETITNKIQLLTRKTVEVTHRLDAAKALHETATKSPEPAQSIKPKRRQTKREK